MIHQARIVLAVLLLLLIAVFQSGNCSQISVEKDKQREDVNQPMLRRLVYLAKTQRRWGSGKGTPAALDLMIALDGTAVKRGYHHFELQKNIVSLVASEFGISSSGTRISLVSLSHRPRRYFHFNTFLDKECTIRAINNIRPTSGISLNYEHGNIFASSQGLRDNALRILVLFVNEGEPLGSKLRHFLTRDINDVEVFVTSVGSGVSVASPLRKLASKPYVNFLKEKNYYELKRKFTAMKYRGLNKQCKSKRQFYYDECERWCTCQDGESSHEQCYRVRKEFTKMTYKERVRFVETIKQANLDPKYRKEFSRLTNIHTEQFFKGVHERDFFLPWHRWYLYEFENFLRQIDCRVTIPYWDWARVAKTFWRESRKRDVWNSGPHGLGGNGRSNAHGCVMNGPFRKGHWYQSRKSGSGCVKRSFKFNKYPRNSSEVLKTIGSSFDVFEHNVRKVFHSELHCLVGGTMGGKSSSQSPEFWLHHAFLDKIWVQYQMRGDKERNEYYPQVMASLPGCQSKWRPGDFVQEKTLPGCVRVLYEEIKDYFEERIKVKAYENKRYESVKYKDQICIHYKDRENEN